MDDEKKCRCPNCAQVTIHVLIPYLGLRCMMCFKHNKQEEYKLVTQKNLASAK